MFLKFIKIFFKIILIIFLLLILFLAITAVIVGFVTTPSNDRNWNDDQTVLPYAEVKGDLVSIHNVRNFSYTSTTDFVKNYYDKVFDLKKLKKVWYIVEPFSGIPGSAHTFLSFEFADDQFLSVSVEIRKEKGESFHPVKGLFNKYELMYVLADERDVVKLRSNYRKDLVYMYPVKTTQEKTQALFIDVITRVNHLKDNPEFYNTITNTCTTNIVKHVDAVTPGRVPFLNLSVLFPESSDELAYKLGLIDTELSFEDARRRFYINDKALKYADDKDFSKKIRAED